MNEEEQEHEDSTSNADELLRPKTIPIPANPDVGRMPTMHIARKLVSGEIPVQQKAYLEISGLSDEPIGYELTDNEIVMGRSSHCQIQLPVFGISRVHARIRCQNEEYYIEDLDSTNGTYVNNIRIKKCVLRSHDVIEIGGIKIVFIEEKMRTRT